MENKITIIIPTYNRPLYLRRALEYWSIYPVDVIVVDGSSEPSIGNELINYYKNLRYFNLAISVEKRLLFASEIIKTPYAAIISDDEFLLYSALVSATQILDLELEVSAVLGATIGFNIYRNNIISCWHYRSASNLSISAKFPKERLIQRLSVTGNSIFYPLVRTNIIKLACAFIGEQQYSCPYIAENQMEAILCVAGKVRVMPKLMWLRSFQEAMVSNHKHDRSIMFYSWAEKRENDNDLKNLIKSATKYFALITTNYPPLTGNEFVELFIKTEKELLDSQKKSSDKLLILRKSYSKLPSFFRKLMRDIFFNLFKKTPEGLMPMPSTLRQLSSYQIEFDKDEISRVEYLIKNNSPNLSSKNNLV